MILAIIAVGETYRKELDSNVELLKKLPCPIIVLSDKVEHDCFFYKLHSGQDFSYFEKLYFSLELVERFGEDVLYADVKRLKTFDFENLEMNTLGSLQFLRYWPLGDKFENYIEQPYWRPFIQKCESEKIDYKNLPAIDESLLLFKKTIKASALIDEIREIQPVFREMWKSQHVYKAMDNAEGLALSYALQKCLLNKKLND
jgi:hypothetical protein